MLETALERPHSSVLSVLTALVRSCRLHRCRPHQWVKNLPVFAAVMFTPEELVESSLVASVFCFTAFCLVASAVYLLNDVYDIERDREHPVKRRRPIASGQVSPAFALQVATVLAVCGLWLAVRCNPLCGLLIGTYLAINLAYSMRLKHVAVLDVLVIAFGFTLRGVAGAFAIGVLPSYWLIASLTYLALFIGFSKRRSEFKGRG